MGNQNMQIQLSHQDIKLNNSQLNNLQIYRWRSQASRKCISKVILQTKVDHLNGSICFGHTDQTNLLKNYELFFEAYVCSFQSVKGSLNLQDCIYVLKTLLQGYQQIYNTFRKVVIHPKCIFLTPKGEIKVWINPNYCLNQVWNNQDKFTEFKKCDIWKLKNKQPKFVKVDETSKITVFYRPPSIISKIIQLIKTFSDQKESQIKFFQSLQSFVSSNILQNYSFRKIHEFINHYVYENNLVTKKCLKQIAIQAQNSDNNKLNNINSKNKERSSSAIQPTLQTFPRAFEKKYKQKKNSEGKTSILTSKISKINKQLKKTINLNQSGPLNSSLTNDSTWKIFITDDITQKKVSDESYLQGSSNGFTLKRSSQQNEGMCVQKSQIVSLDKSILQHFQNYNKKGPLKRKQHQILPQFSLNINSSTLGQNEQRCGKSSILKVNKHKFRNYSFSHNQGEMYNQIRSQKKKTTINLNPTIIEWQNSKQSSQVQEKLKKRQVNQNSRSKKRTSEHSLQEQFINQLKKQKDQIVQDNHKQGKNYQKFNNRNKSQNIMINLDDFKEDQIVIISPKGNNKSISRSQFAIENGKQKNYQWLRVSDRNQYAKNFQNHNDNNSSYNSHNQLNIKTIRTLFSGNNTSNMCSSIGSMSSESNNAEPYSGILAKMGRSAVLKKDSSTGCTGLQASQTTRILNKSNCTNKQNSNTDKLNRSLKF